MDQWILAIKGADAADWVTVFAYLVAAVLSLRAAGLARDLYRDGEKRFWIALSGLMLFLGINELLDLQSLLTGVGRNYAREHHWYEQRRHIQYLFVVALGIFAVALGILAAWVTWRMAVAVRVALVGLIFIGLFVLYRAASFNHLDAILTSGHPVFNVGAIQELLGVFVVGLAALLYARPGRGARQARGRSAHERS